MNRWQPNKSSPINARKLILCADDYAQNAAICDGINQLAKNKRINAISCLVNMPLWTEAAIELKMLSKTCFIGLHLNLTMGQPLSALWQTQYSEQFTGLPKLILKAYLHQLQFHIIKAEIQAQLETFKQTMQGYPDFIDGHQHIQQLPIIRQALLAVYREYRLKAFIRHTFNHWHDYLIMTGFPKSQLLALMGGRHLRHDLHTQQIATNTSFSGLYHFAQATQYARLFKQFLARSNHGGLIMCHPGVKSNDPSDPLAAYRHHELHYLLSEHFLHDLNVHSCQLLEK